MHEDLQLKRPLILRNRCIGCRTRAGLLQVRDSLWFLQDEVPENTTLYPIAFAVLFSILVVKNRNIGPSETKI